MIDFISILAVQDDLNSQFLKVTSSPYFSKIGTFNKGNIQIKVYKQEVSNLKIGFRRWRNSEFHSIFVRGSIHKFYKGNNYTDFNLLDLEKSIQRLCNWLDIPSNKWELHGFEFGVNLNINPNLILNNIVNYNGYEVGTTRYENGGKQKRFELSQHDLKIYDKGKENRLNYPCLRYEIKAHKMAYFGREVHWRLNDLLNPDIHEALRIRLAMSLDRLIVTQKIKPTSRKEHILYEFGRNPLNWAELKRNPTNKNDFARKRTRFNALIDRHTDVVSTFKKAVLDKCDTLVSVEKLPILRMHYLGNNYSDIVYSSSTKRCLICGSDISNQQSRSLYCSEKHTGSRKCRDKAANFIKRERRLYPQPTLFDVGYGSFAYFLK